MLGVVIEGARPGGGGAESGEPEMRRPLPERAGVPGAILGVSGWLTGAAHLGLSLHTA